MRFIGIYFCMLCSERFTNDLKTVKASHACEAIEMMAKRHPIATCIHCKMGQSGMQHGLAKLIGVEEYDDRI
jgi:hypothetical protein